MNIPKKLLAGLGGAIALNVLHQAFKDADNTPRIDLVGEEALGKGLQLLGTEIKDEDNLYAATLAGDILSNAAYYSTIGIGDPKNVWKKAVSIGLAAGVGAVSLPGPMGLDDKPVTKSTQVKILTVAYYLTGALVTAGILEMLRHKE